MQIKRRSDQAIRDALAVLRSQALGMWRYRWLALIVAWGLAVVGWIGVYSMADVYSANARVYVDTQNAIEDFLDGIAVKSDVMSDVTVVVREIVSRPNLAEVARNTDLALRANDEEQFAELLTSLQNRISVDGNREGVFSISFQDPDRTKALAVVDSLLTAFVEKSLGADRTDSAQAQQFLQEQIAEYEKRLTEAEDKRARFKRDNVALMPDQQGDYFTRLQAAETGLQDVDGKLNLAVQRRTELQRQIEGEEPVFGIMDSAPDSGGYSSAKIRELELQLAELRLQYTDKHPRIGQLLDTIDMLKGQEAEERERRAANAAARPLEQNPLDLNPVYQNMRIQLSNVDVEIAALRAERDQHRRDVATLRRSVDTIPQVEAELNRLNRDYDVVKAKHQELLQQLEIANIGEDVSRSIDEVQFRVIDPPFSDTSPVGPNRPVLLTLVLMLAVGAGGALSFLMNQLNPTFIGNRSVSDVLGIPVLASVSLLQTTEERQAEQRGHRLLQAAAAALLVSFIVVTLFAAKGSMLFRQIAETVA